MTTRIRIGALISGGGTNLQAIIDSCESGAIDGQVVFVGSDNPAAAGLKRARSRGISTFVVDYGAIIRDYRNAPNTAKLPPDFDLQGTLRRQQLVASEHNPSRAELFLQTRAIAESRLLEEMSAYSFDLLVLAGFMRNLTPYFIDRVNTDPARPRIMNIHPALLPAFPGVDGYGDTFRYGCKVGGCTVHFIDYGEDSGPIIGQKAFDIADDDTLERIKEKGLALEWQLYPECIQLFAHNRLRVEMRSHTLGDGTQSSRRVVVRE